MTTNAHDLNAPVPMLDVNRQNGPLMAEFENWAAGGRCRLVGLATRAATEFYEELGFEDSAGYFKRYLGPEDRTKSAV